MTFDSLINEGEYFPSFYLDEILPKQLKNGPLKDWTAQERQGRPTPRQGLRDLAGVYLDARAALGRDAEKFGSVPDAFAFAAQEAATAALKALGPQHEVPDFQPQPPRPVDDGNPEAQWRTGLADWHARLLHALGFRCTPGHLTAHGPTGPSAVPVLHSELGVVVLAGGFAENVDDARGDGFANRLPAPVRVAPGKTVHSVTDLAAWVLAAANGPRYAVLLFGAVLVLGDREGFARGRYLAVNLDTALPRMAAKAATVGEIDLIAALFGAPSLRPREDGVDDDITRLLAESRDHSVGVTAELRVGLQKSVQLIANEVLNRARAQDVQPDDLQEWLPETLKEPGDLPKLLTTESLRYLYRILFLLYAEARPELVILPMKSEEYVTGYSVARLRELVVQEKLGSSSRRGLHFHESLALLFDRVFRGHPTADTLTTREGAGAAASAGVSQAEPVVDVSGPGASVAEDDGYEGVRIEALRSRLFDPASIKLVGQQITYPEHALPEDAPTPAPLDLRLRNEVLHQVLRHLTLKEGKVGGRGGFISYANLSINHLGAVYEGLMSYTGFIAREALYEVAKGGDPEGGSWLINAGQVASGRYPDEPGNSVFVKDEVDRDSGEKVSRVHPVGSYVYRLAGRDRQTSASYYTPESLTQVTVEQALRFRLDDDGNVDPREPEKSEVKAADVLRWRVCEPALGSGAFLNEAVNQLAELYLRLAQHERGEQIDPEDYQRELQKVKAYIALHNAYGVDLNDTAVELAEISLWLNTMYPGMKAPWYGLHLHRGNSLIGAVRKVYGGQSLSEGGWLNAKDQQRPRHVPLTEKLPGRAVHQFLLPALGWGSVAEAVSIRKPAKDAEDQTPKSVVAGAVADWLEPERIQAMMRWRAAMRRAPKGDPKTVAAAAKKQAGKVSTPAQSPRLPAVYADSGQGALDLGMDIWEQPGLDLTGAGAGGGSGRGLAAVRREQKREDTQDKAELRSQTGRLRALALRVEYLWGLVVLRLRLSEQEIARSIDVWGARPEDLAQPRAGAVMDRDAVLAALRTEGSPYWRLKQLMDTWCALWFWPLEEVGLLDGTDRDAYFVGDKDLTKIKRGLKDENGDVRQVALKSLDDWLEFAEAVVGRVDADGDSLFEIPEVRDLEQLDAVERELDAKMVSISAWAEATDIGGTFPWFGRAYDISAQQGFQHWELDFAHVFVEGGFDLMVGNPPWVKQEWREGGVLAEFEPWFELAEKPSNEAWAERKGAVLVRPGARSAFLGELGENAAASEFMASLDMYPELAGTQPDLYRAFMVLAWRTTGRQGVAGLIHPSTHLAGAKERALRRAAYRHLRFHADFANELLLFANPVGNSSHFSVNVYSSDSEIRFQHMSWLLHPQVLARSLRHDGTGAVPAVKHEGKWDLRPHRDRIITVDRRTLAEWGALAGEEVASPVEEVKLLYPVMRSEESAIAALARWSHRLGSLEPRISRGFDEKNDRTAGYFSWSPGVAQHWNQVIIQGTMLGVATPYSKQPPKTGSKTMRDYDPWDHVDLAEDAVPCTNYRQLSEQSRYVAGRTAGSIMRGSCN
ncbi:hypothetical protein B4N89_29730 [Embleya scabrispora]|uniref:site-specific DNA-methyltransferase (adenine-specific) n=1 Tax=Embleya scabrispora TaxID=159449 RepID=A0A1T3P656_9ACTN|nr:DNA methyltransferase [Embleya scabrispora]OPC84546.1 hypothetical protein B4N89_29730 [Embleya scabrispora]